LYNLSSILDFELKSLGLPTLPYFTVLAAVVGFIGNNLRIIGSWTNITPYSFRWNHLTSDGVIATVNGTRIKANKVLLIVYASAISVHMLAVSLPPASEPSSGVPLGFQPTISSTFFKIIFSCRPIASVPKARTARNATPKSRSERPRYMQSAGKRYFLNRIRRRSPKESLDSSACAGDDLRDWVLASAE